MQATLKTLCFLFGLCITLQSQAATLSYSWTGFIESRFANPFGFGGDGDRNTTADATPFTLTINLDDTAFDKSTSTTQALFDSNDFALEIDGLDPLTQIHDTIQQANVSFRDSTFDALSFNAVFNAPLPGGGTSALGFGASANIPGSTFNLGGIPRSAPPTFDTAQLSFASSGTVNSGTIIIYTSLVSPTVLGPNALAIPEPATALLSSIAVLCGIACTRGRRRD